MTIAAFSEQAAARFRLRMAALSHKMLLPSLGTSSANAAPPTFAAQFHASIQIVQCVVIAHLLAVTSLIVGAGRLGDMPGRRQVLLYGIGIVAAASACGSIAPSLWSLIVRRGVQGFGAAIMIALTVASARDMMPKDRTGSAKGPLGTVSAVGMALGPSLGGLLINTVDRPSVVVFSAMAGAADFMFGRGDFQADTAAKPKDCAFDFVGLMLMAVSLGAFALSTTPCGAALVKANDDLDVFAMIGLASFVTVERRSAVFQTSNTTVMPAATAEPRGVTFALLAPSRSLGRISRASAMGAVLAFGSMSGGLVKAGEAGLRLTFAVASVAGGRSLRRGPIRS